MGKNLRRSATLAVLLTAAIAPAAPAAGPPADYTQTANLSAPTYDTQRQVVRLPAFDGAQLYLEITRPVGKGRFPVILEASPLPRHARRPRRHADPPGAARRRRQVARPDRLLRAPRLRRRDDGPARHRPLARLPRPPRPARTRATSSRSSSGPRRQPWSNGRVGMTGHSYVGSTPSVAAAQDPEGPASRSCPRAGLASMYDHQFQGGVPYFLQCVGPDRGLRADRDRAQAPARRRRRLRQQRSEDTGCGLPNSAAVAGEDQLSGRYADWHAERDWRARRHGRRHPGLPRPRRQRQRRARRGRMDWFTRPRRPRRRQGVARPVGPRLRLLPRPAAASSGPTRCTPGSTSQLAQRDVEHRPGRPSCSCPTAPSRARRTRRPRRRS